MPLFGEKSKSQFLNALHTAIWWGNHEVVELLLKYTNDVNGLTGEWISGHSRVVGVTALSIAAEYGHTSTIELLLTYPFKFVRPETYLDIKLKHQKKMNNDFNLDQYFSFKVNDDDDDDDDGDDDDDDSNNEFMEFNFPKDREKFWSNDYIVLRNMFSKHEDIDPFPLLNIKDSMGETAIFYAVKGSATHDKKFKVLRILMELSFIRIVNKNDQTLLHKIAEKIVKAYVSIEDLKHVIQTLVAYGVSKHKVDNQGFKAYEYQSDVVDFIREASCPENELKKTIKFSFDVEENGSNKKRKLETSTVSSSAEKIQKSSSTQKASKSSSSSSSSSSTAVAATKKNVSKAKYLGPFEYRCDIYEIVKQKVDSFYSNTINATKDYKVLKDAIYDFLETLNALVTFNDNNSKGVLASPQTLIANLKAIEIEDDDKKELDEMCLLIAKLDAFDYEKRKNNSVNYDTKKVISSDVIKLSNFVSHFLCLKIYKDEFLFVSLGNEEE